MRTTIDRAGRLVVPKALREAAGLRPGTVVEIALREGHLEVAPATAPVQLVERHGLLLAEVDGPGDVLTRADVNATLDEVRRERGL